MWRALVNPFRSRWKGRKGAVHKEERLEPITPRIVAPQLSSEATSCTAPTHPPLEPTLHVPPTQHPPEQALSQPLPEHDLCLVPTHPPQEPTLSSVATRTPPEATPNFPVTQPPPEPTRTNAKRALQILCGSHNNSFGSLAITTVQGNMIIHQSDCDELRRAIADEIRSSIPAMVRHSNENALVLTDALGETLTVPWSFVPTYEVLLNHPHP
ncbi:hypothetical protein DFP72DRAFT_637025 [Ephemerocybe angulata]|uniref:Uncharacterized protein n=1 Tax=Ephemerocybe angulata TaxID=980116 RepID=A0A8H6HHA7_9AGAR|nr:hypothetical protein DFP72DRAFT_637025 [Tulosesus angulatus]